jgi:hypothetical protein
VIADLWTLFLAVVLICGIVIAVSLAVIFVWASAVAIRKHYLGGRS